MNHNSASSIAVKFYFLNHRNHNKSILNLLLSSIFRNTCRYFRTLLLSVLPAVVTCSYSNQTVKSKIKSMLKCEFQVITICLTLYHSIVFCLILADGWHPLLLMTILQKYVNTKYFCPFCPSCWPLHRACRNSSRTQASSMGLASWMQAIFIKDWCFPITLKAVNLYLSSGH